MRGGSVSRAERPKLRIIEGDRWRDHPTYSQVYASDWRDLCAFLRARFGPGPPEPEDIAQQAFFNLGEQSVGKALQSPRAFVFRVAINLMLDGRRSLSRAHRAIDVSEPLLRADDDPDVERALIAKEQMRLLESVVTGLPDRHRLYLAANRLDGMSFTAIAKHFGVSPSLVRKTIDEATAVCQRALATGTIDYKGLSRERNRQS